MVSWQELNDLRLGKLDDTISQWTTMLGKLERLADGGGEGVSAAALEKKAHAADWTGKNATVTKEFVTKSAREFDDVVSEARSVRNLLRGTHAAFKKHKERQRTIVEQAAKKNIYVHENGAVSVTTPSPQAEGGADVPKPSQKDVDAVASQVKRLLWEAGESDRIAARALRQLAKDKHSFAKTEYSGLKDADRRQGKVDADAAVKLASQGEALSDDQLRRLNEITRNQRDNSAFTERFATRLGSDGTLQFWRDLASPGHGNDPTGNRAKLLGRLQGNLSMSLANASHSHTPAMEAWKKRVIADGPKQFGHEGIMTKPYGFQIMSNLMGKGSFDKGFLNDYGNELHKFERSKTKGPFDPAALWANPGIQSDLDYSDGHGSLGSDPMTGFLKATGHNPEFATELFSRDDMADYLLKDREYYSEADPLDNHGGDNGPMESREALGKALFAGGSGIDPDDPVAKYVEHTQAHNDVFNGALDRLAGEKDGFPPEIRDDMANLIGNHGDEAHKSMSSPLGDGPLNRDQLLEVSKQISRNKDSYSLLNEQMNAAIVHDIHTETGHPEDSLDRSGRTVGFLEEARYQAVSDKKAGELLDASWKRGWVNNTAGTALGYIPHAGPAITAGVSMAMQGVYEDEVARAGEKATVASQETNDLRERQLRALGNEWYSRNSHWAEDPTHDGYSKNHGLYSHIGASANDGKQDAREDAGDQ